MNGLTVLSPLQALLAVAGGLAMLVGGGEMLVIGATRLARQSGMSMLLIGLTVVAFGTSVPELSVSLTASLQGHPDIMIGNVVGSNIANIGLILGLSALLQRLDLNLQAVRIELLLVIAASIILMLCSAYGRFPRSLGIIFVLTLIVYTFLACRNHTNGQHSEQTADEEKTGPPSLGFISFLVLAGLALLTYGATIFIRGAADMARYLGVSELIIGLTLAAVGTSLPELATSLSALRRNESGLLIGNIIGSNMFNLLMVLGLTAVIKPFALSAALLQRDLPVMLAFSLALVAILQQSHGIRRWHGLLFLAAYGTYYYFLFS